MSAVPAGNLDVVVVGAGPVGCVAALAHAARGARVAVLEANPASADRLAGEWLHPTALSVLRDLGLGAPPGTTTYPNGRGFAVFPDDGSESIVLPYGDAGPGASLEHRALVDWLRAHVAAHPSIRYLPHARATIIDGAGVHFLQSPGGTAGTLRADRVVGADGRNSLVRASAGLRGGALTASRMVAARLRRVPLPIEGYGHVFLGGPGPLLAYRIDADCIRLVMDVPGHVRGTASQRAYLWDAFSPVLPVPLRRALSDALRGDDLVHAMNRVSPRDAYGAGNLLLAGDAVGYHHPLTAVGMTLGFQDAICAARCNDARDHGRRRRSESRVPELLAAGLHDVFADTGLDAAWVRTAIYRLWRGSAAERVRTMRILSCADTGLVVFLSSFTRTLFTAAALLARRGLARARFAQTGVSLGRIGSRAMKLLRGDLAGFLASRQPRSVQEGEAVIEARPADGATHSDRDTTGVITRATAHLLGLQREDGSWEGEMTWCPMIAAQYAMTRYMAGSALEGTDRRLVLHHFARTTLPGGAWGLHEHAAPSLYVTTLVYVAARLLGEPADGALLQRAGEFIRREHVTAIPTWGKVWLAMLGLYDWRGVTPSPPELWSLPEWLPFHPRRFYCHTRQILLAMSVLYGARFVAPESAFITDLRRELYGDSWSAQRWHRHRGSLRLDDLYTPPGWPLRLVRVLLACSERLHSRRRRARLLAQLRERIRWELHTTDYTSLSPVSGLLNILALRSADAGDPDAARALARMEGWIWRDEQDGLRVTGARSLSWDTAFALQALTAATASRASAAAVARGAACLAAHQITESFPGFAEHQRSDPAGGWCFAGAWHGWPVSDCTAEALGALLAVQHVADAPVRIDAAVQFLLRSQNPDGGFGSYEACRAPLSLEFLNPAEMFADSMTERSYVECTASCIAALAEARAHCPERTLPALDRAIADATAFLLRAQADDGAFSGAWGVCFIYGTMFGVRGLLAGGLPLYHPAVRRACQWLKSVQHADGGFGESHASALTGHYCATDTAQVIQTAWALLALLDARDPDWPAITRAAAFLADRCRDDGSWPRERMVGIFFRTALLHYDLYRTVFPLWALSLYEARRRERREFLGMADAPGNPAARLAEGT